LQFIAELESEAKLIEKHVEIDNESILEFETLYYQFDVTPDFELLDHDYLDSLLDNYTLSATHLNSYLKCPISFYFNHVLKVPSAKSESASFGTAIHDALEELFKTMQNDENNKLPSQEVFIGYFEKSMRRNRDSFTDDGFKRHLANGKIILPPYYENNKEDWEKETVYTIEKNITHVELAGVPIKGKLDRIVFEGHDAYVIDFKTGNFERAIKKCKPPKPEPKEDNYEEQYGGDYWRQMVFYHLLIENDRSNTWHMERGEMNFVEPNKHGDYHRELFRIDREQADMVKMQIVDVYKNIKSHKFEKGCGDSFCHWCNFVKYYLKKERYISNTLPGSSVDEDEGMS
jgi:DNA helicase-2/ATP-dependent DNA helicase PcrA